MTLDVGRSTALLCAVVLLAGAPSTARAAGVVGTGTADSCTDAALDAALAGGGLVTFDCGGPVTLDISGGPGSKTVASTVTNSTFAGRNAFSGGGIANYGTATLTNCPLKRQLGGARSRRPLQPRLGSAHR